MQQAILISNETYRRLKRGLNSESEYRNTYHQEVPSVLTELDQNQTYENQLREILERKDLPSDEKNKLYSHVLDKILNLKREQEGPISIPIQQQQQHTIQRGVLPHPSTTSPLQPGAGGGTQVVPTSTGQTTPQTQDKVLDTITTYLPIHRQASAIKIYTFLKSRSSSFTVDENTGEFFVNGARIKNSNIYDILSNLAMKQGGVRQPRGYNQLALCLSAVNIPKSFIENKHRVKELSMLQGTFSSPSFTNSSGRGTLKYSPGAPSPITPIKNITPQASTPMTSTNPSSFVSAGDQTLVNNTTFGSPGARIPTITRLKRSWQGLP